MPLVSPQQQLRSIDEQIYHLMRERLLNGEYDPGQWLYSTDLEKEFGVSRSPVRNALGRLEVDGLVEIIPRKGAIVPKIFHEEILEMFDLLHMLETRAVELTTMRGTSNTWNQLEHWVIEMKKAQTEGRQDDLLNLHIEFHRSLYKATGSPKLREFLGNLTDSLSLYAKHVNVMAQNDKQAVQEHRKVLEGMKTGDVARAKERYFNVSSTEECYVADKEE